MRVTKEGKKIWSRAIDCDGRIANDSSACGSSLMVIQPDLFIHVNGIAIAFRCMLCGCVTEVSKYDGPPVVRRQSPLPQGPP